MSKNYYEQSKITSFITTTQNSKQSKLPYNNDDSLSESFDFDNFENSTTISEDSNNEQDLNNDIELKKSKYTRFDKKNLKWNPNWKKTYPWVDLIIKQDSKYMVCTWCIDAKCDNIFVTGTQYFKEQYLQRHIERSDHKKVVYARSKNQINILSSIHQCTEFEQLQTMRKMMNIYFLVKHNIATLNFEDLCHLVELQIQNTENSIIPGGANLLSLPELITTVQSTRSEYGSYINDHAGRQFIAAIAHVIEEAIFNELRASKAWSLMIDESNTISNEKNLAIVSRHILHNLPVFRYLGIVKLQNASSNAIFNELDRFILAKHLPLETLYHFGSDGASVNLGHVNGIATKLKNRHPFLTEHHCISHRLALASKDAAEQTPYFESYDETVRQLYSYFSRSYSRLQALRMMQNTLNEPNLDILQVIKTRWLSLSNVVNNLYQIINSVISALLEDASKGQKTAQQLYNSIDDDFLVATHFLADILSQLRRLSLIFQANYVSVSEVTMQVNAIIESITTDFIGTTNVQPTFGTILLQFMNQNDILPNDILSFIYEFAENTVTNIKLRFPDFYGNHEINKIGNFYRISKKIAGHEHYKVIDADNFAQEWRVIRSLLSNYRSLHITTAWHNILRDSQDFSLIYPNIYTIISIILCLPLSNAYVERVFSKQNLIKTKLRNRMNSDTLNDILMISLNGPPYDEFNYKHAYQFWR
ncbi:12701_t:CDS:2, partial [Cetraspora pellucida]